jgi:hypothetical protein
MERQKNSRGRISKSMRVFIRREKARIRRGILSFAKQEEFISGLYKNYENK